MTWTALRWVWRLEAPLFVGMHPAGALNRCRPYVPARAIRGAITAELARRDGNGSFPKYEEFDGKVGDNCRFTYLFPAEKRGDDFVVWLPKFEKKSGIQWCCYGDNGDLSDRDFRRLLLDTRPGTAIAPQSDSARDGTLRETECICPWWRDPNCQQELKPVFLLGYIFLKNTDSCRQLDNIDSIDTLFVGGDTRYGLGKLCRVEWHDVTGKSVFGKQADLNKEDGEDPEIHSDIVWGHALEGSQSEIHGMQGAKELLGGWDQGNPWKGLLTWAPGSFLGSTKVWSIDEYGYWIHQGNK